MKIILYSDVHISRTSSILPIHSDNYKYTYRQNMILQLSTFITELCDKYKPDMIINLGDTFDNHTITSYDVDVASEFFYNFRQLNIPHLVIVGNHEMVNQDYNAIKLLNNISNITVIDKPCTIQTNALGLNIPDKLNLAFLPYCDYKQLDDYPQGDYLFSHIDIEGSSIRRNIILPVGVSQEKLNKNYKLVFNGHIHKPSIMGNIVNVGSCTTHSFSDDDQTVPQCYLFDTNTLNLQAFKVTVCPLFRKYVIDNESQLIDILRSLDKEYKYVLHITCPYNIKDVVKSILDSSDFVLNSRLNIIVNNKEDELKEYEQEDLNNLTLNTDIDKTFKSFLDTVELKYPKDLYYEVLNQD